MAKALDPRAARAAMDVDAGAVRVPARAVAQHGENLGMFLDIVDRVVERGGIERGDDGVLGRMHRKAEVGGARRCAGGLKPPLDLAAERWAPGLGERRVRPTREEAGLDPEQAFHRRQRAHPFDLPVESEVARTGTALPPDGGEPGRAVLAHFGAIEKNDFKALKATASPERQAMMTEAEKAGEAKEMFKMLRDFSPRKVRVVGGTVDGDTALVDYEGVEDGKPVKGTAEVVRVGGKWFFEGSSNSR